MKKFLWINPVAEKTYGDDINKIKNKLLDKGYIIASCDSQISYVKNQYIDYSKNVTNTILDCRCPEAINLLKRKNLINEFNVPDIEPILVRTSRVLYEKYIKNPDDVLIITCPCTQLRDFTRSKLGHGENIKVYTWKEFAESIGIKSLGKIDKSPIPLGFFQSAFTNIIEVSEENEIIKEIKNIKNNTLEKPEIVEMLYCKDGCNNGDGL